MKALLVAINAKYIHTSLSVRTLKAYAQSDSVEFAEYTINERAEDILRSVYLKRADVVLFSCYIWNIEMCLAVAQMLKKVAPHTKIILGGPEVSYDEEYISKYENKFVAMHVKDIIEGERVPLGTGVMAKIYPHIARVLTVDIPLIREELPVDSLKEDLAFIRKTFCGQQVEETT